MAIETSRDVDRVAHAPCDPCDQVSFSQFNMVSGTVRFLEPDQEGGDWDGRISGRSCIELDASPVYGSLRSLTFASTRNTLDCQ